MSILPKFSAVALVAFLAGVAAGGCVGPADFTPAIKSNRQQAEIYEELRQAFSLVIEKDTRVSAEYKAKALADIEANRIDFYRFNGAQETFLVTAGQVQAGRLLEVAAEVRQWRERR